jgi:hypothetical protein
LGFFQRLLVYLLKLPHIVPVLAWKQGLLIKLGNKQLALIRYNNATYQLTIQTRWFHDLFNPFQQKRSQKKSQSKPKQERSQANQKEELPDTSTPEPEAEAELPSRSLSDSEPPTPETKQLNSTPAISVQSDGAEKVEESSKNEHSEDPADEEALEDEEDDDDVELNNFGLLLRLILEAVESVLEYYYPRLVENTRRLVPCTHCLKLLASEPFMFTYNECMDGM